MSIELSGLQATASLRAAGYSPGELRRLRIGGTLRPLRRGAYTVGELPDNPCARHALLVRASMAELCPAAVASHVSAAVLYGLPVWGIRLDRAWVTRARRSGGRRGTRVHVRTARLRPGEVTVVDGMVVTSPARTIVDLARSVPFEQAVVVTDAALARGLVDSVQLEIALRRAVGWPGAPAARRVVAFADGRAESVGESRSRVALLRAGLPAPVPQWEVIDAGGRLVGRVDFGWPELRTVGEFDGRLKYGRLLRAGESAGDVVFDEKIREDALRGEDLAVVRWTWADLDRFDPVAERLRRSFHQPS